MMKKHTHTPKITNHQPSVPHMDEYQAMKQGRLVTHPITSVEEETLHQQCQESIFELKSSQTQGI